MQAILCLHFIRSESGVADSTTLPRGRGTPKNEKNRAKPKHLPLMMQGFYQPFLHLLLAFRQNLKHKILV
jgi:hypothetical protein